MPKREKKDVEQERKQAEELALERELMLAPVTETPAQAKKENVAAVFPRTRSRLIDRNGFALPKPDRRWLH
ncbi:MAG TPA: hypothetical protein VEC57_00365 [Candidatus Limnocylindrales bacterium]|nr:hypothetical protein [Candidatus Limnocylindrales bacterium]